MTSCGGGGGVFSPVLRYNLWTAAKGGGGITLLVISFYGCIVTIGHAKLSGGPVPRADESS